MTVHPFRTRGNPPSERDDPAIDHQVGEFPYDFHEDFADFDDSDEAMTRYGSIDRQYRYAHRTISAPLLAILTSIQIPVCQVFHRCLFGLLENVGDFDGLIATPKLLITRTERAAAASTWLAQHPQPDVAALLAASDPDESCGSVDRHITENINRHSLGLAAAADSNPSLTLGSVAALQEQLIDDVLDLVLSCQVDEIQRLTATAIDMLGRMPASIRLIGGAAITPIDVAVPPDGVTTG